MVGLSVILDNCNDFSAKRSPQIISKGTMIKPSSPSASRNPFSRSRDLSDFASACDFLQICSLCKQKLSPGKDIYMYKGDKAFCSVECRCRQIFMDEEETGAMSGCTIEYNCSMAATSAPSSSSSSRTGKGENNAFAY